MSGVDERSPDAGQAVTLDDRFECSGSASVVGERNPIAQVLGDVPAGPTVEQPDTSSERSDLAGVELADHGPVTDGDAELEPTHLSTHTGRRSVITALYNSDGTDLADIARHVGHTNTTTTASYVTNLGNRPQRTAHTAAQLLDHPPNT